MIKSFEKDGFRYLVAECLNSCLWERKQLVNKAWLSTGKIFMKKNSTRKQVIDAFTWSGKQFN